MTTAKYKHTLRQHRFTLVELMVAMGVFSIMMLALMTFFNSAQKLWTESERRTTVFADVRIAMDLMATTLQTALYEYNKIPFYLDVNKPASLSNNTDYDMIYYVSNSSYKFDTSVSNIYEIGFAVDANRNLQISFIGDSAGAAWNYYGSFTSGNITDVDTSGTQMIVIPYVTRLKFVCYDKTGSVMPTSPARFPYAVQIQLSVLDKVNYLKWQNASTPFAPSSEFRVNNERTFYRMVYIGERGQQTP